MIELKDVLINYHDSIRHIKTVELNANNLLSIRKNDPKNNGVGYLYLYEVYEMLGIPFNGDRNIGITTKSGDTWHNLYSPWISVKDRLPDKEGDYLVCYTSNAVMPYIDTVGFATDLALKIRHSEHRPGFYGFNDYSYDDEEENPDYWLPLPEPPEELKS